MWNFAESSNKPLFIMLLVLMSVSCSHTQRANVRTGDTYSPASAQDTAISGNGRYTAFVSVGYFNGNSEPAPPDLDVFLHDHQMNITERISVDSNGVHAQGANVDPIVNDDGNIVAFRSTASNLVTDDTNGMRDVFVRDRQAGTTERINVDSNENQSAGDITIGRGLSISGDGRYVAFDTRANGLVAADTDNNWDVYVRDRLLGTTEIVSIDSDENHTAASSFSPSISDDGRYIAFVSAASWGPLDTNGEFDVYLRDRVAGFTQRVSINSISSLQSNGRSDQPAITGDGLRIAYVSTSTDLVADDNNAEPDVFVYDRTVGQSTRVSLVGYSILEANGASDTPSISNNGRFVAFRSDANNLVAMDTNGVGDLFVRDTQNLRTFRVSDALNGDQSDAAAEVTRGSSLSNDGRYVAFRTYAQLIEGDNNTLPDAYHRFALAPDPVTGGGTVTRGSSANLPFVSGGWLDSAGLSAVILPANDITVNNIVWTGFPGSESAVVQITVAPGAATGPRDVILWNPGTLGSGTGASFICADCLIIN